MIIKLNTLKLNIPEELINRRMDIYAFSSLEINKQDIQNEFIFFSTYYKKNKNEINNDNFVDYLNRKLNDTTRARQIRIDYLEKNKRKIKILDDYLDGSNYKGIVKSLPNGSKILEGFDGKDIEIVLETFKDDDDVSIGLSSWSFDGYGKKPDYCPLFSASTLLEAIKIGNLNKIFKINHINVVKTSLMTVPKFTIELKNRKDENILKLIDIAKNIIYLEKKDYVGPEDIER